MGRFTLLSVIVAILAGAEAITNATSAKWGQFPYHAQLVDDSYYHNYFCGGAILNKRWVATAAQCVYGKALRKVEIIIGEIWLDPTAPRYFTVDIRIHPEFDRITKENDIAVVKGDTEFFFDAHAQPLPILDREVKYPQEVFFSGWGAEKPGFPNFSDDLRFVSDFQILPLHFCSTVTAPNIDSVCGHNPSRNAGACGVEEGSILAIPDEGLIGLFSFRTGECGSQTPNLFISLFFHRHWIRNQTAVQ